MERLVHRVSVASLVLVGLLPLGGCVGRHYVNQTLYGPTEVPQVHTDLMIVPNVEPDAFNTVQLAGAPVGVQDAFRTEHPHATVTRVAQQPAGNGLMLYQVTYIEDGIARQDTYRGGGNPVDEPGVVIAPTPGDDMHPTVRAGRPATGPAMRGLQ